MVGGLIGSWIHRYFNMYFPQKEFREDAFLDLLNQVSSDSTFVECIRTGNVAWVSSEWRRKIESKNTEKKHKVPLKSCAAHYFLRNS